MTTSRVQETVSQQLVYSLIEFWKPRVSENAAKAFVRLERIANLIREKKLPRARLIRDWQSRHESKLDNQQTILVANGILEIMKRISELEFDPHSITKGLRTTISWCKAKGLTNDADRFCVFLVNDERGQIIARRNELLVEIDERTVDLALETFREFNDVALEDTIRDAKKVINVSGRPTDAARKERDEIIPLLDAIQGQTVEASELLLQKLKVPNEPFVVVFEHILESLAGTRASNLPNARKTSAMVNGLAKRLGVELVVPENGEESPIRVEVSDSRGGIPTFKIIDVNDGQIVCAPSAFPVILVKNF